MDANWDTDNATSSTNDLIVDENNGFISRCMNRFTCTKIHVENTILKEKKDRDKNQKIDKLYDYLSNLKHFDYERQIDKIEDLLDRGANRNYKTKNQEDNVFHLVAKLRPKEDAVKLYIYLKDKGWEPKENYYGVNILHTAAFYDNQFLVQFLIDEKKEELNRDESEKKGTIEDYIETKSYGGEQTAFHLAAKNGSNNALITLLENGAQKEARDYLGRTALYLAAEYGRLDTVKLLLKHECSEKVVSKNGQKALFWIIAKCRSLAPEVLDNYRKLDQYNCKDTYYLKNIELELIPLEKSMVTNTRTHKVADVKSILEYIVEKHDLELITHPVISKFIDYKWKTMYWYWSFIKFFFVFFFCVVWNLWGVLIPYDQRYIYNLPQDTWRIILFILGIIGVVGIIFFEVKEAVDQRLHNKKITDKRLKEILDEGSLVHPRDKNQNEYLKNEERLCQKSTSFRRFYLMDGWNLFDVVSIILLITSLGTHLADIVNHNETIARNHIRITSVTVLIVSLRVLKSARTLWEPFGMLVMTLYFIVRDIIVWLLAFIVVWIPFTSSFYMLFGNGLKVQCTPGSDSCSADNTTLIEGMQSYNKAAFFLFTATFGAGDFPYDQYNELDNEISDFIVGLYIGATTLILVNIFIALLSTTFERVHSFSRAFFLMERASEMLKIEKGLWDGVYVRRLQKIPHEYNVKYRPDTKKDDVGIKDLIDPINQSVNQLNYKYESLSDALANIEGRLGSFNSYTEPDDLRNKIDEIKKTVDKLLHIQESSMSEKRILGSSKPQVNVLYLNDIESTVNE